MRVPTFFIAALLGLLPQVLSSGSFELRLKSFTNDLGRLAGGACCSGPSAPSEAACQAPCRTKFRVCLKIYQANIDTTSPCTFGDVTTPVLGDNSIDMANAEREGFSNPISFPFEFTWPGTFSLIVEAWHDVNETSRTDDTLIARMTKQGWLDVGGPWREEEHNWAGKNLRLAYRVTCAPHYYGPGCKLICRPRDDNFGHYTCSLTGERTCLAGWEGEYCTEPRCLPGCDGEHGHCTKPDECKCQPGWEGRLCDHCQRYPGCMHGYCHQPWECLCDEGWGGLFCNQDLNYCTNRRPCQNGGTCLNTGQGSYTCVCTEHFSGNDCERSAHSCDVEPCLNGGRCLEGERGNRSCLCAAGFAGPRCETRAPTCADSPCARGSCEQRSAGRTCICPPGYSGERCELETDACAGAPCANGGTCSRAPGGPRCTCPPGYSGERCELDVDECAGAACAHGATCVDLVAGYRCQCVPGYIGRHCETRVDLCLAKPCANGGRCSVLDNDYECACRPGFAGKDCSVDVDECAARPCLNGATCRDRVNGFHCECAAGWAGDTCGARPGAPAAAPGAGGEPQSMSHAAADGALTARHVAVIAALSAAVPALALAAAAALACVKRRRRRRRAAADAEARAQNERNAHSSHVIKNTWGKCASNNAGGEAAECQNAHNASVAESASCKEAPRTHKQLNTESAARLLAALDPPHRRLSLMSHDSYCNTSDQSLVKRLEGCGSVFVLDEHCLPPAPTFATQV